MNLTELHATIIACLVITFIGAAMMSINHSHEIANKNYKIARLVYQLDVCGNTVKRLDASMLNQINIRAASLNRILNSCDCAVPTEDF